MSIIGAVGNYFKALGYMLIGRLDAARETLESNPQAVKARYESIIQDKVGNIQQYKKTVATLIAQQEKKLQHVGTLTTEVEQLENLKTGAMAKARQIVKQLQEAGRTKEEIHGDLEYGRCLSAFQDFSSTLEEKQSRITELEESVATYQQSIAEHKVRLQDLLRDLERLRSEAAEAVADLITAKEEKELNDMLAGISEDGKSRELEALRDLRQKVQAESRISKELAGTDTQAQEDEFLAYAQKHDASDEFDALVGL